MKKIFTLLMLGAATLASNANIGNSILLPNENAGDFELIPAKFCAGNAASILFVEEDDDDYTGKIYSKDMQPVKTIDVPAGTPMVATRTVQEAQQGPVGIHEAGRDSWVAEYGLAEDQVSEWLSNYYGVEFDVKDGGYYYPYDKDDWRVNDFYYEARYYGDKYIRRYYTYSAEESALYEVSIWYENEGWGFVGWGEPREEENEYVPNLRRLRHTSETSSDMYSLYFTQHLFNGDDLWEYVMPVFSKTSLSYENEWEKVSGESVVCTGFKVMNENGATVTTVEFPAGYLVMNPDYLYLDLIDLGDVYYIGVEDIKNESGERYALMYRIDPETNSVKAVSEPIRTKVSPTAPKAGTPVNVELGGAAGQNARVSLIGESGLTVWSKALQPGATTTAIETSHLKKGVYVVVVSDGKSSHESTKIIIR